MTFFIIININKNIIKIYNNKNVKFFIESFDYITLKNDGYIN